MFIQNIWEETQHDTEAVDVEPVMTSGPSSQGLAYIAGFLARKLSNKYPYIGSKTSETVSDMKSDSLCPYIENMSRGSLMVLSDVFLAACHSFEKEFNFFHNSHKDLYVIIF